MQRRRPTPAKQISILKKKKKQKKKIQIKSAPPRKGHNSKSFRAKVSRKRKEKKDYISESRYWKKNHNKKFPTPVSYRAAECTRFPKRAGGRRDNGLNGSRAADACYALWPHANISQGCLPFPPVSGGVSRRDREEMLFDSLTKGSIPFASDLGSKLRGSVTGSFLRPWSRTVVPLCISVLRDSLTWTCIYIVDVPKI